MRWRIYIWLNVVVMTCYIVRPVVPFIEYAVNRKYIENNLCINRDKPGSTCHGKCHLNEQLGKSAENGQGDRNDNRDKVRIPGIDDHLVPPHLAVQSMEISTIKGFTDHTEATSGFSGDIFIPPKS